jgi:hypothetical protein
VNSAESELDVVPVRPPSLAPRVSTSDAVLSNQLPCFMIKTTWHMEHMGAKRGSAPGQ